MAVPTTRLAALFSEALALPPAKRGDFLEQACGNDAALRQRLESLLAFHEADRSFLRMPEEEATLDAYPLQERAGTVIGRYKLLEQIGEGGFGVVFMAEQTEPVSRKVALKVIKLGMDTKQVVARFEAERQALAMMDHPNIAKVLDGGSTESGRPYFVMELVKGISIQTFCNDNKLTTQARLELFIAVCAAVHHAHQKGIIHRDLKPGNVLVTLHDDKPVPKVIDFGVAKATQTRLTENTLFTGFRQMIGTPAYMSPEQAEMSGSDVDTRSDIYSLGVLLYELLTGTTPFDARELRSAACEEMKRIIREVEPPSPSTRLGTLAPETATAVALQRRSDPKTLNRMLKGDLDWIVMKCLEKDRTRRYDSATGLGLDLQRYLKDEAVEASPPSTIYKLRKFARRYRKPLRIACAFMLLLVGATVFSTWQAVRARHAELHAAHERDQALIEKKRADEQAAIAQAVSDFLTGMFDAADPSRLRGDKVTVLEAIHEAVNHLDEDTALKDQPLVEAAVRDVIGNTLYGLARFDEAQTQLLRALEIRRRHLPADDPLIAQSLINLAHLYMNTDRSATAEPLFREALTIRQKMFPKADPKIAEAMSRLGLALYYQNKDKEAEPLLRSAVEFLRSSDVEDDFQGALNNLAEVLADEGKFDDAEKVSREALTTARAHRPPGHPEIGMCSMNLATILQQEKKLAEAEPFFRDAVAIFAQAYPNGHPYRILALHRLVVLLEDQYHWREKWTRVVDPAHDLYDQVALASPAPQDAGVLISHYGLALYQTDQFAKAYPFLLEAHKALTRAVESAPQGRWDESDFNQLVQVVVALRFTCEQIGRPEESAQWRAETDAITKQYQASTQPAAANKPATNLSTQPTTAPK